MDENDTFNMTENLDFIITLIDELKEYYDNFKESVEEVVKLTLDSTRTSQSLNILLNNRKYRKSFIKVLDDMNNFCKNNEKSDIFNNLINVVNLCKYAIPLAKKEGKEIV